MTKKRLLLSCALVLMSGIVLGMKKRPIVSVFEGVSLDDDKQYVETSLVKCFANNQSCGYVLRVSSDGREEHCVLPSSDFVRKLGTKEGTFIPWDEKLRMKQTTFWFKKSRGRNNEGV